MGWRRRGGEGGREGGVGGGAKFVTREVGIYGCQNDGLDELDTIARERRRK